MELALRRGPRRILVGIQRAGGVFGDIPLLCEMPFPYAAVARTPAGLLRLPKDSLTDLLARHPAIALRWLSSVVKRLEGHWVMASSSWASIWTVSLSELPTSFREGVASCC